MSDNPTSMSIPRVDGLSTDPPVLERHTKYGEKNKQNGGGDRVR